jgi:tetratricopeptide (TPR) repeat protein
MFREAIDIDRRTLGSAHPELAIKLVNVAQMLRDQDKLAEAEPFAREAVELRRKVLGPDHPALANALDTLSSIVLRLGRADEAEASGREALAISRRASGESHPETARLESNLGWRLYALGRAAEAEALFRQAGTAHRQTGRQRSVDAGRALDGLAFSLYARGDHRGAEAAARQALAIARSNPADGAAVGPLDALGRALLAQQRSDEAVSVLREAQTIRYTRAAISNRWYQPDVRSVLGAALAAQGDTGEAEELLLDGYDALRRLPGAPRAHVAEAAGRLMSFYRSTGRPEQAALWKTRLDTGSAAATHSNR